MQKWEYKIVVRSRGISAPDKINFRDPQKWDTPDIESLINKLGAEGWELVSAWSRSDFGSNTDVRGGAIVAGMTTSEVWTFKRPLE